MSNNLDETLRLQFEKRLEWIREVRGQRLQGIAVVLPVWPIYQPRRFPGRNECPGTHCSLIVKEKRRQFLPESLR